MQRALRFNELFDPDFLSALTHLSLVARRVAAGGRHGERLSKDLGAGVEFKDFRPYSAGDDLRAVDWNIYRRLGKLSLRLFEEQQELPLYLMPDVSESLFLESPPRIIPCLRATLALAAIGVEHQDAAGVFPFDNELQVLMKPRSGRASVMVMAQRLADKLSTSTPAPTDLAKAVETLSHMKLRPGLVVVISDFFDPQGIDAIRKAFRGLRHRLLLIQLVRATDANPDLEGDVRLSDCETGEIIDLSITPDAIQQYKRAHATFEAGLAGLAGEFGSRLLRLDVEQDVVAQLETFFEGGIQL